MRTYCAFVLLGVFWGSNFIYMKWAAAFISPAQISLLRVLFGFAPLAVLAWHKGAIRVGQIRYLHHFAVMAALATAFPYFAMAQGTTLLPSGIAGVLGGSSTIFTSLASGLFLRNEKMNRLTQYGVALGMAGITLIARPWAGMSHGDSISLVGVAWMMSGSALFGFSYIYARRFLSPTHLAPLAIVIWQMGLALLMLVALTNVHGIERIFEDGRATAGIVIGLGLLGTGSSFILYYYLLQKLGAVAAAGAVYITPVVALLIGWSTGEEAGPVEVMAAVLILGSIAMLEAGRQYRTRQQSRFIEGAAPVE
ncbi:DMT family transporter [Burkholderia sp. Ac-20353]|uniref:DMT family transporter n=1 Tax=Burkholderia sp. Ac-20353 TaxID=2703894 RepID=UPI001F11E29E|nr:DMT family transporter [Burkholderia sp. Ac-20353]MBN3785826.1 DMT family transporter [Burkholderia sp. Ac-20353]